MDTPSYPIPLRDILSLGIDMLSGASRSFRGDALQRIAGLRPELRILGREHIPQAGPRLITLNHYHRPGFDAWWLAFALAAAVPAEIHFGITDELTYPGKWYGFLGRPVTHWLLLRLARVYGFTAMPPMPPRPQDVERRAAAVRRMLAFARSHPQALLALAPEGGDRPDGAAVMPPPGAGRFIEHLARLGFPLQPAGIFEQEGRLCLHFGPPYALALPPGLGADERDRAAARQVMEHIAALLPERLRGEFSGRLA
jgi:hypothetical protein